MADNTYLINKLKKQIKLERKKKWYEFKREAQNKESKYINCFNFIKMMEYNENDFNKNSKHFIDEFKYLKESELSIINKLRTEYINLNDYKCKFFKYKTNTCEKCKCNCIETVNHYLLDCIAYNKFRKKLKRNLKKINIRFKYENNHTVIDWLFPHIWQSNINRAKFYETYYKNIEIRMKILRLICTFVNETERFKGEYGE